MDSQSNLFFMIIAIQNKDGYFWNYHLSTHYTKVVCHYIFSMIRENVSF